MCLIFLGLNTHPEYKLIMVGNRDEFYLRKTAAADFWHDHPQVLGGRDLEAFGTWLGITMNGRLSMLTNFRDALNIRPDAPSRGKLVSDFLLSDDSPPHYMGKVASSGSLYNGFNLIAGTASDMFYYSNYGTDPVRLSDGFYGLSNHLLDTPWPKVKRGKLLLKDFFTHKTPDPDAIFQLLYDSELASDDLLPSTGLSLERERALSSMFIKTEGYGSRSSTIIYIDRNDTVFFTERVYDVQTFEFRTKQFEFPIIPMQ